MESITLEEFVKARIEENKELFTQEELRWIEENRRCINKVYLLGVMNTKKCYENDDFAN